jgi:hypothetical protein
MSARVRWEGLEELQATLRELPATLTAEATGIVETAAASARDDMYAAYPRRTGTLRDGLAVATPVASAAGVVVVLQNRAKDAGWFEKGTQVRHTKLGANRGAMPPGHVFWPRFYRWRRTMWTNLAELVRREGLTVTGAVDD